MKKVNILFEIKPKNTTPISLPPLRGGSGCFCMVQCFLNKPIYLSFSALLSVRYRGFSALIALGLKAAVLGVGILKHIATHINTTMWHSKSNGIYGLELLYFLPSFLPSFSAFFLNMSHYMTCCHVSSTPILLYFRGKPNSTILICQLFVNYITHCH